MIEQKQFDIVVYGASSFVGQIVVSYLFEHYAGDATLSWAVAGRSASKLSQLTQSLGAGAESIPVLLADAHDLAALTELCKKARVIIATVGPYDLYGEDMIQACVATGTDYCDLTGEVRWMNRMRKRYEQEARTSGARLVHSCGFDSLPSDMGVWFLQQQAKVKLGRYCSRVAFRVVNAAGSFSGGTVATMINEIQYLKHHPAEIAELNGPYALCPDGYHSATLQHRITRAEFDKDIDSWIMPFMMAPINEPVVFRSQALLGNPYGEHFRYNEAIVTQKGLKGMLIARLVTAMTNIFTAATASDFWRQLMMKYMLPKSGEGPSPEAQKKGFYNIRILGFTDSGESVEVRVTGDRDPGYGSTAKMLVQSAVSLLKDISKEDKAGGFWTTATIFDQRLIERLRNDAGMTFELVSVVEKNR